MSNGLKFRVKVTPVTDSSVIVTDLDGDEPPLLWLLEQAAIPRLKITAAARPFTCLCFIVLHSKVPGRFFTGQRC